ncbi:MAG TPA: hypothetical protein VMU30_08995 [Bacteroidota bacterium]|nr:hypothetical protein [Bacteroidota bacterium]
MKFIWFKIFILFCIAGAPLWSQTVQRIVLPSTLTSRFFVSQHDSSVQLPRQFIFEHSDTLVLDSLRQLFPSTDYTLDYRSGKILFTSSLLEILKRDTLHHILLVRYQALPIMFQPEYSLRHLEVRKDSTGKRQTYVASSVANILSEDLFGAGLKKSGSLVRGFTVGTNRDMSLTSGLRLQLSGKLAQDIEINAALTDENSPIQPEGTTQTLREVDKVYVEIKSPNYDVTLGDFNLNINQSEGGEFGQLNRKLQGAHGTAAFNKIGGVDFDGSVSVTAGTARGIFTTNQLQGMDGVQGPYQLSDKNGQKQILVIAGSERVYLNGELMTRGETNDYTIDYSIGEITFSSKRLMTNASRLVVDFEYTNEEYTRNAVGGSVAGQTLGRALNFNISFYQEADDPDAPVNYALTDSMRRILAQSGTNKFKASVSGLNYVGPDSGIYILRDTVINGTSHPLLVYAPGNSAALFSATFSYVASMPADSLGYTRIAAGEFQAAGLGAGNYLPIQFLPMPQLHQAVDIHAQANVTKDFSVAGEYAVSKFSANRFSADDSVNEVGGAMKFSARYNPKQIMINGKNFGAIDMNVSERFVDHRFVSLDRVDEVEFNRKWDVSTTTNADEQTYEMSAAYSPIKSIQGTIGYGSLERTGESKSDRTQIDAAVTDTALPIVQYHFENIHSSDFIQKSNSTWIRQRAILDYSIAQWHPGFRVEMEDRNAALNGSDSSLTGSFTYLEIAPKISSPEFFHMTASAEVQFRSDDSAAVGSVDRASNAVTQLYSWQLKDWKTLSSTLTLSIRNVEFTDEFKRRGNTNNDAVLVRSETRYSPLQRMIETEWYYEFSDQRSAKMQRVFVQVTKGTGNYKYLGDLNGNGIKDENEFELTNYDGDYIVTYYPSDELYPVADLKTSMRFKLQPARLLPHPTIEIEKILKVISTETNVRVSETSDIPDTKQIYLLHFSKFLNDSTTLNGSNQLTQDVFLFENDPDLSFRFRYNERNSLQQLVSSVERGYLQERSVRVRSQLIPEISNQTDFTNTTDRLISSVQSISQRDLLSDAILTDFSYRPDRIWEIGFTLGVTEIVDRFISSTATSDINQQGIRVTQSFPSIGQLRIEFTRKETTLSNVPSAALGSLPYEFTQGNVIGKTLLWQATFDYRLTSNIQLSANYSGRLEGTNVPVHQVHMEARAFF